MSQTIIDASTAEQQHSCPVVAPPSESTLSSIPSNHLSPGNKDESAGAFGAMNDTLLADHNPFVHNPFLTITPPSQTLYRKNQPSRQRRTNQSRHNSILRLSVVGTDQPSSSI
uniref:Uncharacterized protein n=1 Tax=Kalanchoe fedtschenkoi TaxID=63787 RepID=A0A7N0TT05_KALFE